MADIKFSIAISTYNRLSLLRRAVDSALAQTVPCEVVVVDDCSSDETEAYLCSLSSRIVYHRNARNMGHSATVNVGVQVASGDWIKPVDDDDYLAPNCIEEMTRAIVRRPQAVICSCQAAQVDIKEVEISRTRKTGPGKVFYVPQEDIHYGMLMEQIPFGTPIQVAFRRDAFIQSGGWDSHLDVNFDDIDSWIKIARFGDAIFINRCLAYRTVWPGGYNHKFSLQTRLQTHITTKNKIYDLADGKYRSIIPDRHVIEDYLKLHWAIVAVKQKRILEAVEILFPSVFSIQAWRLLIAVILLRRTQDFWLEKQLYTNMWVMANLYASIGKQYPYDMAGFEKFRDYLRLRFSLIACQQGKFLSAVKIGLPSAFSFSAWQLLIKTILLNKKTNKEYLIRKVVLID